MDKNKVLIFDFDGTIADSGIKVYEIINEIFPSFGIRKVDKSEIEKLRGFSAKELIKDFKVPVYKMPFIFYKFEEKYRKLIDEIQPIPDIKNVLKKLNEDNIDMNIASSSPEDCIRIFLKNNNLEYFKNIKGSGGLFGKKRIIGKILKEEKALPENTIYIGDEIRDIESARKAGVRVASVTWGFNNKKSLEAYEPDFIIEKPEDLLDFIK